jgi:hypothetical protein
VHGWPRMVSAGLEENAFYFYKMWCSTSDLLDIVVI